MKKAFIAVLVIALTTLSGCSEAGEIQRNAQNFKSEKSTGKVIFGDLGKKDTEAKEQSEVQKKDQASKAEKPKGKILFGDLSNEGKKK